VSGSPFRTGDRELGTAMNTNAWNRIRYSLYAPFYDAVVRLLDRGRRRSIEKLGLSRGERVLIVGCGTGLDFAHVPAGVRLVAGDITPAMVRRAQRRARRLGLNADVRVLDAHRLDLPDESVDAVLLHLILAVVPDPEATIREVMRVLRPGGRIGIFDKFIADGKRPGLVRRLGGIVLRVVATDVNRSVEPLLRSAGLAIVHDEPVFAEGFFRVIIAERART
jgi:phosphatidylethanolamine/phosphatidyl-N-methylethanolamine N-methyltransferase